MKLIKNFLIFWLFSIALGGISSAVPVKDYLSRAQYICLARITSIESQKVIFSVIENFRGNPGTTLILTSPPYGGMSFGGRIRANAECVLVSQGDAHVGAPIPTLLNLPSDFERPSAIRGWIALGILRYNGGTYAISQVGSPERLRNFLRDNPYKP